LSCHIIDGVGGKDGPNLSKAGEKLDPGMIERRIVDPTDVQIDAEMPALGDKIAVEDIRALAQWLGKRK
jgi:mono/diheme cytochrome c family protein